MDQKALRVLEYEKITEMLRAQCSSVLAKDAAGSLAPSDDRRSIEEALEETEEASTVIGTKGVPPFGNFYDISGFVHLAAKEGRLTFKELLEAAYNLASARRVKEFLSSDSPQLRIIDGLASAITVLKGLEDEITRCIISEDEMADSASSELARIRRSISRQNEAIRSRIARIVGSADNRDYLQDSLVTMRQGRFVIPVKAEHKSRVSGIVHDQSSSGATLFIEPQEIVTMNNELRELELAEKKEMDRITLELSAALGREELKIRANQEILTRLDFIFAKGRLADKMTAMRPKLSEDGHLLLRKARHPLIDRKKVVPITMELGGEFDTLVITGPNTGGKTVTLKTTGLLCAMAQSGLFIPAADGTAVPVYRNIFADIGDEQSIAQSLSTFSSHMVNIVGITEKAGEDTLVLLDELGAGTDPAEGAALAMAILDRLYGSGAQTVATTHYTELKKYALTTPGVRNASMEFDVETLSPTYRLSIGVPGKSNAFEISKKLGLDPVIIDHAAALMETGDVAFEDVLSSIEQDKRSAESDRIEALNIRESMVKQKARMETLEKKLEGQREKILADAKEEARELLEETEKLIKDLQKEISDAKLDAEESALRRLNKSLEDGRRTVREKKEKYTSRAPKEINYDAPKAEDISEGARVNVLSVGQKGVVLSQPDAKGDFMVQIGSMKLGVNISGVTLVRENNKPAKSRSSSRGLFTSAKSVPMSVNVIGKTLGEAEIEVDKYIDDAFMAGYETVTVVHGRGAGILREGLGKLLRANKHVASIRKGGYKEGGDGVTVVTLKK